VGSEELSCRLQTVGSIRRMSNDQSFYEQEQSTINHLMDTGNQQESKTLRVAPRSPLPAPRSPLSAPRSPALIIILIIFTALALYNSAVLPLGEAADETDHYQYLRFVARTGHPPLTEAERTEAGFKGGLAPLYYWLTAWPIALIGEETLPDIRRVDSRPERHIPTDGLGINHVLHTLDEQWPWRGQVLAWHLVRLLSVPLGWITIIATYALVRCLVPEAKFVAIAAAAFVAFLPRFVISSAVINDDNLVFALIALLLLTQVLILQGHHRPRTFAIFGALFGLALVTKYFSLILMPEVLLTLFLYHKNRDRRPATGDRRPAVTRTQATNIQEGKDVNTRSPLPAPRFPLLAPRFPLLAPRSPLLAFLLALAVTAGPWFSFIILRFQRIDELGLIPGLAASLGEPQITKGLTGLLSGQSVRPPAATYALPEWFSLLYRSFWFEYGWMRIFAPAWVYGLFTLFLLAALAGLILGAIRRGKEDRRPPALRPKGVGVTGDRRLTTNIDTDALSAPRSLLTLHLTLFVVVVLARYILSATIDTGQGRHLYPALPVMALLIALGLDDLRFWIYDLRFTTGDQESSDRSPLSAPRSPLSALHSLLPTPYFLLPTLCFLLPALIALLPSMFVLPHYRTQPVTTLSPAGLPVDYRHPMEFAEGLSFIGFDVADTASAGQVLPVTLYWHADQEAEQDYLVSLCLADEAGQPVGCWRGHFANGHYPARAWEAGDTLIDTVFLPIPTCYRLDGDASYQLRLELWPLALDSARPVPEVRPVLSQTFAEPSISIRATDSALQNLPQTADIWHGSQRLTQPATIEPNETLTQITYMFNGKQLVPAFERTGANEAWQPLTALTTPLYPPCADGPTPLAQAATFVADPTLPPGSYRPQAAGAPPELTLSLNSRLRILRSDQGTVSFASSLSPLSLQVADQPAIDLSQLVDPAALPGNQPIYPLPHQAVVPITIRWQARRWMANPLVVSLKLLDKDFMIGGERIATLGDRYPNVLWVPTETIEETYPLRLKPDAPPGLYRLELSVIHQDPTLPDGFEYLPLTHGETTFGPNLYPLTIRLLDPTYQTPPTHAFSAQLGDSIHLAGYDLNPAPNLQPATPISLTLYWQSTAKISTDYTVFTQLLGSDGQVWAQWDNPPQAGRYPTTAWTEADRVADRYSLTLREGAPPGDYRLLVGMYDPATGDRLPVAIDGRPQPEQAIELTTLSISP
jgi:uncharacterized membrane protein